MDAIDFFDFQVIMHMQRDRRPRLIQERLDPFTLSDYEFKKQFRFSKPAVRELVRMLDQDLTHDSNRGLPLSPQLQVCLALSHYGGGHFQRVTAMIGGVSQYAFWNSLKNVTDSLLRIRGQFIYMPSVQEMEATEEKMHKRFGLPRFAMVLLLTFTYDFF